MSVERAKADWRKTQQDVVRLEGALQTARARAAKLAAFLEVAGEYGLVDGAGGEGAVMPPAPARVRRDADGGKRGAALRVVLPLLAQDRWVPTRHLVDALTAAGIVLADDVGRSVANLSSYLSREPSVTGQRGKGWRLVDTNTSASEPAPPENVFG